ncbi:MAG: alpha/beta hydrolase [Anaerolineaceae bacterium]|nr:alpha/beta hydrolase [Anaerolineaceae bacterium]
MTSLGKVVVMMLLLTIASGVTVAQDDAAWNEYAVTLDNGIAAIVAEPAADGPVPAVLMLHGFASYKDEVGEMYKRLAGALAERGIASLRLDFRGWGESEGGMENSTVQGMVEDAATGYAYLAGMESVDASKIGVIGFSLGGRIAIVSASQNPEWYQSMVLWSTGGNIPPDFLGQDNVDVANAEDQITIDLGWREVTLGAGFFESLTAYDVETEYLNYSNAVMIVAGSEDPGPNDYLSWYLENAQGSLRAAYMIENGDHIYAVLTEDQTMADEVITTTADWFALSF